MPRRSDRSFLRDWFLFACPHVLTSPSCARSNWTGLSSDVNSLIRGRLCADLPGAHVLNHFRGQFIYLDAE